MGTEGASWKNKNYFSGFFLIIEPEEQKS